ncbi:MAG: hypothetical protein KatS3mg105_4166 [Gemmatales bacterium]|nr:MAG: hypothetical protein KatS3mg105_4166 [Gemmatales bacterium]
MAERHSRAAFVRQLLAQEKSVPEEKFRIYRRQLDARLTEAARRSKKLPFHSGNARLAGWALAGAAAALFVLFLLRPEPGPQRRSLGPFASAGKNASPLFVVRPQTKRNVMGAVSAPSMLKPMGPWQIEIQADVIALAVMKQPFEFQGEKLIKVEIEKVLFGQWTLDSVRTKDDVPFFGCLPPEQPTARSSLYQPGSRVIVFLDRSEKNNWSLLALRQIDSHFEEHTLPDLMRVIEARKARDANNPQDIYRRLLEKSLDRPNDPLYAVLSAYPDPQATAPLVEYLSKLPSNARGQRELVYAALKSLLPKSDNKSRLLARDVLLAEAKRFPLQNGLAQALGTLADEKAIGALAKTLHKQPIDAANHAAQLGLQTAYHAGQKELVVDAWISFLQSFRPGIPITPVEKGLVFSVVRSLKQHSLTEAQRRRLAKIRNLQTNAFLRQQIDDLLRE